MGGLKARVMYRLDVNFKINDKYVYFTTKFFDF